MKFKKVDILISENLTKEQLKEKVLTELNKVAQNDGYDKLSIHYIANIHDIYNGKYWVCMDTETKEYINAEDELIDLQAIFRYIVEDPESASDDLLYSSKYVEDNFTRLVTFLEYKTNNDNRVTNLEDLVNKNEADIEDKHKKISVRVAELESYKVDSSREFKELKDSHLAFKENTENNINAINNVLNEKANIYGSEGNIFKASDPVEDYDVVNKRYLDKNYGPPESKFLTLNTDYTISPTEDGKFSIRFITPIRNGVVALNRNNDEVLIQVKWNIDEIPYIESALIEIEDVKLLSISEGFKSSANKLVETQALNYKNVLVKEDMQEINYNDDENILLKLSSNKTINVIPCDEKYFAQKKLIVNPSKNLTLHINDKIFKLTANNILILDIIFAANKIIISQN